MVYQLRYFCILVYLMHDVSNTACCNSGTLQCPIVRETKEIKFWMFLNCDQIYPNPP